MPHNSCHLYQWFYYAIAPLHPTTPLHAFLLAHCQIYVQRVYLTDFVFHFDRQLETANDFLINHPRLQILEHNVSWFLTYAGNNPILHPNLDCYSSSSDSVQCCYHKPLKRACASTMVTEPASPRAATKSIFSWHPTASAIGKLWIEITP